MILLDNPIFTEELAPGEFRPPPRSTYLYAVTSEDRSEQAVRLRGSRSDVTFIELREPDSSAVETTVEGFEYVPLRDSGRIAEFLSVLASGQIVIDITGLSHTTWVPLVKIAIQCGRQLTAVYFEPTQYTLSANPRIGEIYDLSEKIQGIGPLPLMVNLTEFDENAVVYVPLLGFEGARAAFMFEQVNPDTRRMYPIVGLPGFRIEYPFEAFLGNHQMLMETKSYREARFAKSNCPFSLYYQLQTIREAHPGDPMRIGLTGTKPHALGALLFAIREGDSVELVYDHVKRKARRTSGTDRCVVYHVSSFMDRP